MWMATGLVIGAAALTALLLVTLLWHWFGLRWWMVALVAVVLVVQGGVVPVWRYHVHRWEVTDTAVYTQTGWWRIERRIAPMSRVQTVDYEEGAVARLFGLARVTVTTASAAGALEIEGLDKAVARDIADRLTVQADVVPGDAT